ncbi:MAG: SET domain-containing protein-lysine N-methyltransferase [Hydrotalea flava]|uniref:SET domain-containing protein n=1 Tax=Hydrotalea TaxID=1004300 RepID=UPI00082D1D7F|nr:MULTISPECIES: SET domain-containing protein [Hydrotalea]RTL56579.1 MAG: SET domain-containing protein-lysine N-methyltransferase [Sphingobacteriales bacterium]MBY0347956.1 SET domain-containing protein [Hydrotalea flava]NIM35627.1 SET domain-containing protein-lysine N-methyltransferase [Hydrotalea flava]NIM38486.1 SET domain-containing protein-lysine N-methyltransferase [Hydrotalea flava]NIN04551.1 SET domain-containing protein-lysine N-methyltransferase [Hydrotalea flava]
MILPDLIIAPSPKGGRGVFALAVIPSGTIIEISPVLVFSKQERLIVEQTLLYNYIFEWGRSRKLAALGLGYLSLYNHDYDANADYTMDFESALMTITTVKKINKGDEIFINYNANPNDTTKIWFDAK